MSKLKKIVSLSLLGIMIISAAVLGGCGKKSKNVTTINKDTIYKESICPIDFPKNFYFNILIASGDKLFLSGYSYDEMTYEGSSNIFITDEKGTSPIMVKPFDGDGGINNMVAAEDGGAYIAYTQYFEDDSDPDNYSFEECNCLARLDANGKKVSEVNVNDDCEEIYYIERMIPVKGQGLVIFSGVNYAIYDNSLKFVKTGKIDGLDWIDSMFSDKNGNYYVRYYSESGQGFEVKKLNLEKMELGEVVSCDPIMNSSIYPGNSTYDIFVASSTVLSGYNIGDADVTPVMNYIDSDIPVSYFTALIANDDNSFFGGYTDWEIGDGQVVIAKYTKVPPSEYVEKQILSLGCLYLDSGIKKDVINFNKSNDAYRITIKDYSVYDKEENDWNGGREKLNSDIASGQGPDILYSDEPSMVLNYASKGLFVDMYKYLDSDKSINKDDIFPNLLKVCEYNGKLYQITPVFNVQTLAAKTKHVGNRTSWTFKEMMDFEKTLPEGTTLFAGSARDEIMYACLSMDATYYMDLGKGTCKFDSQEFKDLLTYMKTLPKSDESYYESLGDKYWEEYDSMWRTDKAILYNFYVSGPTDYRNVIHGYIGDKTTLIGYPTSEGNGSSISFYKSFSISSRCANPDAAWEFVKVQLSDEYQSTITWNIPASMSRFDELCEEAKKQPEYMGGDDIIYGDDTIWINGTEISMDPITDQEIAELKEFILSVDKLNAYFDSDILDIIKEEAEAYFENQKSVDEVASIIQSRVSIYLSERH